MKQRCKYILGVLLFLSGVLGLHAENAFVSHLADKNTTDQMFVPGDETTDGTSQNYSTFVLSGIPLMDAIALDSDFSSFFKSYAVRLPLFYTTQDNTCLCQAKKIRFIHHLVPEPVLYYVYRFRKILL